MFARGTKSIVWVEWPFPQYLIEVFFRYSSIATASIYGNQPAKDRRAVIDNFNYQEENDYKLLVCRYSISANGINLQYRCHISIILEPANSVMSQGQAIGRVRLISQKFQQLTLIVYVEKSLNK